MTQTINCGTYGLAIKAALDWLEKRGAVDLVEAYEARMGGFGMRTLGGSSGYRLEFDTKSGPHINVWSHKTRGPHFTFHGNEKDVRAKFKQLFWWDQDTKRRIK